MVLKHEHIIKIYHTLPLNFEATFHKPDHFESLNHYYKDGVIWQTFRFHNKVLGVKFWWNSTKKFITTEIFSKNRLSDEFIDSFKNEIKYRYNLNLNLNEFYKSCEIDNETSLVNTAIKNLYGMRPGHASSLYEYLIIGVMLQNTNVKRTIKMLNSLFVNYGVKVEFDQRELYAFWNAGDLTNVREEELRELKLGYRAKTVKKIDNLFSDGKIDEIALRSATFEKQQEALMSIYGVGPATVWYLLFDIFHRYDFFNHISPWEQKILSQLIFKTSLDKPVNVDKLIKYFDKYGKFKQLALHYIWEDFWWKTAKESND